MLKQAASRGWSRSWAAPAVLIALVAILVGAFVAWWLWPLSCVATQIGVLPGGPDPNVRLCVLRSGMATGADTATSEAVVWGIAAGVSVCAIGLIALWVARERSHLGASE